MYLILLLLGSSYLLIGLSLVCPFVRLRFMCAHHHVSPAVREVSAPFSRWPQLAQLLFAWPLVLRHSLQSSAQAMEILKSRECLYDAYAKNMLRWTHGHVKWLRNLHPTKMELAFAQQNLEEMMSCIAYGTPATLADWVRHWENYQAAREILKKQGKEYNSLLVTSPHRPGSL